MVGSFLPYAQLRERLSARRASPKFSEGRVKRVVALAAAMLAVWILYDFTRSTKHDLRDFDPHEVARLETAMWRSYYDHERVRLFAEMATLLRRQFRLPFWRSCLTAYYAARSAVIFQK